MSFPQTTATATGTTGTTGTSTFIQLRAAHLASTPRCAVSEFFRLYRQLSAPFQVLLDEVFAQPGMWSAFARGPSSRKGHHCGPGGNLRHSVDVARLSLILATDPVAEHLVDRDVLIVAALMHDLGKALEYEPGMYGTKMSPLGRLVGHKFTGFGMLWTILHSVPGIGEHQRLALLHCLSCSPQGAFGGIRGPACLEAQIVHHADRFSASTDLFDASLAASRSDAGFGVRHDHQRETPYHVKPRSSVIPHAATCARLALSACELALALCLDPAEQCPVNHVRRFGYRSNSLSTLNQPDHFLLEFKRVARPWCCRHLRSPCPNRGTQQGTRFPKARSLAFKISRPHL